MATNKNIILLGGGVGVAPLIYLARRLKELQCDVTLMHGAEEKSQLIKEVKLQEIGINYISATVDGSQGYQGYITDLLIKESNPSQVDLIYTCGPEAMMAIVAQYAKKHNIDGYLSLEEYMACGIGACLGCVKKLKSSDDAYIKVCKDGPVFGLHEIEI